MSVESVTQVETKATKTVGLVDCRVIATFNHGQFAGWGMSGAARVEALAKESESRCKEFNEFIRDHRSQDDIRLEVERITEEQCSMCHRSWDVDYSEPAPVCANCGAEVSL